MATLRPTSLPPPRVGEVPTLTTEGPSQLPRNQVHTLDCLEGMARLAASSVDVIVTSPPYNIGKPYHTYDDSRPREEYLDWLERVAVAAKRVLADEGSFFLNMGGKPSDQGIPLEVVDRFRRHFTVQNTIVWVKSVALHDTLAVGHYQPTNSARYLNGCHEFIFHLTKSGDVPLDKLAVGVPYQDKSNIGRWEAAKKDLRDRGSTWFIPYDTIQESRPHPAVFPPKLPEMCVRLHGVRPNLLVLDPFMGTGSTALACRRLGVDYLGFEVDPKYVEIARENLSQLTPP